MPRKRKEKLTLNSSDFIEHLLVQYKCPQCDTQQKKELVYIPQPYRHKTTSTETSCWCQRCGARHKLTYSIQKTRNGTAKLTVSKFLSEEQEYNKRFKVLAWC